MLDIAASAASASMLCMHAHGTGPTVNLARKAREDAQLYLLVIQLQLAGMCVVVQQWGWLRCFECCCRDETLGSDSWAVHHGWVSVTPLSLKNNVTPEQVRFRQQFLLVLVYLHDYLIECSLCRGVVVGSRRCQSAKQHVWILCVHANVCLAGQ